MHKNLSFHGILIFLLPITSLMFLENTFMIWMFMELQTLAFLLLIWSEGNKKKSLMIFLIVQMFSGLALFLVLCFSMNTSENFYADYMFVLILFMKMAMMPFHNWGLSFIDGISQMNFFLFLTFMKILPFFLVFSSSYFFFLVLFILNMVLASLLMFFFCDYMKIIYFSSVFLSAVIMLAGTLLSFDLFLFLFMSYFIMVYMMIVYLSETNSNFMYSGSMLKISFSFFVVILFILGMPFSLGFVMKSSILQMISQKYSSLVLIFLIYMSSVIMAFHYMKISHLFFINNISYKSDKFYYLQKDSMVIFTLFFSSVLIPVFFLLGSSYVFYLK